MALSAQAEDILLLLFCVCVCVCMCVFPAPDAFTFSQLDVKRFGAGCGSRMPTKACVLWLGLVLGLSGLMQK